MQAYSLLLVVSGAVLIIWGIFHPALLRALGKTPREEMFTIPAYKKAARTARRLGRAAAILFGISILLIGTNGFGLSPPIPQLIEVGAFLAAWAMLGITLIVYLRAKPQ